MSTTGRIHYHLEDAFGKENVFMDVENMPLGVDFRDYINDAITRTYDVVIAIIGLKWLSILQERMDKPQEDFLHMEVETALRLDKIIPVLVDGAKPIPEVELPESLKNLAYRNAATVRFNPDFIPDVNRLIARIEKDITDRVVLQNRDVTEVLPFPFEWCEITISHASDTEQALQPISDFSAAKYPITIPQYQVFVEDPEGYSESRWWNYSRDSIQWYERNPIPATSRFSGDKRPRERVSWYEARAFCQWLSYKTGRFIFLPTDNHRVRTVRGYMSYVYPWGNTFDNTRCNTREYRPKTTTSVDNYPVGTSSDGVFDLSGNVWEWGTMGEDESNSLIQPIRRVLYGGGWYSRRRHTRADYKRWKSPSHRADDTGFRIYTA